MPGVIQFATCGTDVIRRHHTCLVDVPRVSRDADRWDPESQTGQDTESALVRVALCFGMTFWLLQAIVTNYYQGSPSGRISTPRSPLRSSLQILIGAARAVLISASPPPSILRI